MRRRLARWCAPNPVVRRWVDLPAGDVDVVLEDDPRVLRIKSPRGNIYLVLGDQITAIDPNMAGEEGLVAGALARAGLPLRRLDFVSCTHLHVDHGSALDPLAEAAGARILLPRPMAPYVRGEERYPFPGLRFAWPFVENWGRVGFPGAGREQLSRGGNVGWPWSTNRLRVDDPLIVDVDQPCRELGGLVPLHTPGHCPEHTVFFHPPSGTLLAGDMFITLRGRIERNRIVLDREAQLASDRRLRAMGVRRVWPGHGPEMDLD